MASEQNTQKYSVNQHHVSTLLAWVQSGDIAIPEIQRPFVWKASKVRDLMDSLYKGFPVGYVITWQNPNVRLKDGTLSQGKRILIDGQQRVTALTAAMLGEHVVDSEYRRVRIRIAFHPVEERFEVANQAILKDAAWLSDIAVLFTGQKTLFAAVSEYVAANPEVDQETVFARLNRLLEVRHKQVGVIDLAADLDIETVTTIFIRINSQGVVLGQADFAMSKIAASEAYGGAELRKAIDYFCHLARTPAFFEQIEQRDTAFTASAFWPKMKWLRDAKDDLYDPSYTDMLRVAFTSEFGRGRLADLVALLSGRNFETRTYEAEIAEDAFSRLRRGVETFMNEQHFQRFLMIVRSAGFVRPSMIRSKNALNVAYIVYLRLKKMGVLSADLERYVRRWLVMSLLTGRYSGAAETAIELDARTLTEEFPQHLARIEQATLSDAFWSFGLPQALDASSANSVGFSVFVASQVRDGVKGFLSRDITVADLVTHHADIHHLYPSDYLKKKGFSKAESNQVGNYVLMQTELNIKVGNRAPGEYMSAVRAQCLGETPSLGGLEDLGALRQNLHDHALPSELLEAELPYSEFLEERRRLIAKRLRAYYVSL